MIKIKTEQLSSDTIMFHVRGLFHHSVAKELALGVFRSHHLGFKTFLFDLSEVSLIDEQASRQLALIGQGLQDKGKNWRVLHTSSPSEHPMLPSKYLEQFPKETWN